MPAAAGFISPDDEPICPRSPWRTADPEKVPFAGPAIARNAILRLAGGTILGMKQVPGYLAETARKLLISETNAHPAARLVLCWSPCSRWLVTQPRTASFMSPEEEGHDAKCEMRNERQARASVLAAGILDWLHSGNGFPSMSTRLACIAGQVTRFHRKRFPLRGKAKCSRSRASRRIPSRPPAPHSESRRVRPRSLPDER